MRKTLSIVLSLIMVLSLGIVAVHADEPAAIATAEDFAAMAADGNYKLTADITITATYETDFTGTLDGDGHTITVSVPVFAKLSGTVKNLTLAGEVTGTGTSEHVAPLALRGSGTVVLDKITNNANVNTAYRGAGIISQIDDGATASINDCVNNGTIKHTGSASSMLAGIIAYQQGSTLVIKDCVNNGTVSAEKGLAGGIIGRFGGDYKKADTYFCDIINCLNNGDVSGEKTIGGIAGYARSCTITIDGCTNKGAVKGTNGDVAGICSGSSVYSTDKTNSKYNWGNSNVRIKNCVNEGDVESAKGRAAGMCAYVWAGTGADSVSTDVQIFNNINKGTIKGTTNLSQIMAYTNRKENVIKNNVGLGSIVKGADSAVVAFYAFSTADVPTELKDNVIVNDGTTHATYTASSGKENNVIAIDADGASALVAVKSAEDALAAAAALGNIGYQAPAAPQQPQNPDPAPAPTTGDATIWFAVAGAVALLGMAVAVRTVKSR